MTRDEVKKPVQKCRYLAIREVADLAAFYMPFIRQGGLFIPTTEILDMGEQMFLLVRLPDESRPHAVCARVIWHTPAKTRGRHKAGIGVRFLDQDNNKLCSRIEKCLSEHAADPVATLTL